MPKFQITVWDVLSYFRNIAVHILGPETWARALKGQQAEPELALVPGLKM